MFARGERPVASALGSGAETSHARRANRRAQQWALLAPRSLPDSARGGAQYLYKYSCPPQNQQQKLIAISSLALPRLLCAAPATLLRPSGAPQLSSVRVHLFALCYPCPARRMASHQVSRTMSVGARWPVASRQLFASSQQKPVGRPLELGRARHSVSLSSGARARIRDQHDN